MKRLVVWLFIAFFTFAVGIAATLFLYKLPELPDKKFHSINKELSQKNTSTPEQKNNQPQAPTFTDDKRYERSIKGSKGVLVLADSYGKPNDTIQFFNEDGSLWYKFTYFYDDSDGRFEFENNEFIPFAFHPDYFLLALKIVGEDSTRYKVVVNEETGLTKYIKKNIKSLKFQTWEQHVLDTSSISFIEAGEKRNPLFDAPSERSKSVKQTQNSGFRAVKIKGDWLKVKWDDGEKINFGWVKWKEAESLLIDWYYIQ